MSEEHIETANYAEREYIKTLYGGVNVGRSEIKVIIITSAIILVP